MPFSSRLFYCCVACLLVVGRLQAVEAPPWAHELSEIKPDPRVVWGKLENGLRYAILPNANPKGRVYLQLYVAAGSMHEREDERGLAHFVEHMAFKGTTHFKKDELIEYTQRHGMAFGGDTNAHTAFDHTLYKLALARNDPAEWKAALLVLRDWAGGVTFDPAELESERGVVESERRMHNDVWNRVADRTREIELAGTPYARRLPIGDPGVILSAPAERLRGFYDAWYRPERMVVLVVGEIEGAAVERVVRELFGDLKARGAARAEPVFGPPNLKGIVTLGVGDPELPSGSIPRIARVSLSDQGPDTPARRRELLARDLGFSILQRRLSAVAARSGYNFSGPVATAEGGYHPFMSVSLQVGGPAWRWNENLETLEQQLRAALEFGFTESEVRLVAASDLAGTEHAATMWSAAPSQQLIGLLFDSVHRGRVFSDPVARLGPTQEFFNTVTPEDCLAAFRSAWDSGDRLVGVTARGFGREKEAAIRDVYEKSRRIAVQAPVETSPPAFAYTDFGPPGKIEHQEYDAVFNFHRVVFANGVRLNVKRTAFRRNAVEVAIRFGGGIAAQSPGAPGLASYVGAWLKGGLLKNSAMEMGDLNRTRVMSDSVVIDWESFQRRISTRPQDLRYAMELTAAFFLEPAFAKDEWREVWSTQLPMRSAKGHSLDGMDELEVRPALANGDRRLAVPGLIGSFFYRRSTFVKWFQPILQKSPMEIAIVGDIDPATVMAEVARTFGTLPERRRERSEADGLPWQSPPQAIQRTISYASAAPRSLVYFAWRETDGCGFPERQKISLLARFWVTGCAKKSARKWAPPTPRRRARSCRIIRRTSPSSFAKWKRRRSGHGRCGRAYRRSPARSRSKV